MNDKKTTTAAAPAPAPAPAAAAAPAPAPAAAAPAPAPAAAAATSAGAPAPIPRNNIFIDAGQSSLPNKPNEPPLKLYLNLNKVEFKCVEERKPTYVKLKMYNPMDATMSFKVRCTSADIFRVQPPLGFIKPRETLELTLWFQNQEKKEQSKHHYFAFYHTTSDGRTARELWANAKIDGVRRLPATFNK